MKAALQIESVALNFRCQNCDGTGSTEVFGFEGVYECEACAGDGLEPCGLCGEEPSTDLLDDGTKCCRSCYEVEA